jgi:16S rRNA (cytosine967-C5)-methyltransferase
MLRPGGLLVYCACSLQPEEGPDHVAWVKEANARLQPEPLMPDAAGGALAALPGAMTAEGSLRTFPFFLSESGGMDGFYAVRMRRI